MDFEFYKNCKKEHSGLCTFVLAQFVEGTMRGLCFPFLVFLAADLVGTALAGGETGNATVTGPTGFICKTEKSARAACPAASYRPMDIHDVGCCSCDDSACNGNKVGEYVAFSLGTCFVLYLTHIYVQSGAHKQHQSLEHCRDIVKSRNMYAKFGIEMSVENYGNNAYDMLDINFLRCHRLLLFAQVLWASDPFISSVTADVGAGKWSTRAIVDTLAGKTVVCDWGVGSQKLGEQWLWTAVTVAFLLFQVGLDSTRYFFHRLLASCLCWRHCREHHRVEARLMESTAKRAGLKTCSIPWCNRTYMRLRKILALSYLVMFPLTLSVYIEGLFCTGDTNALDMITDCSESRILSAVLLLVFCLPVFCMCGIVGCHWYFGTLNDEKFLYSWGFLVIGYKENRIFWPFLELVEMSLYLVVYGFSLSIIEHPMRMSLNFFLSSAKLVLQEFFSPYECRAIQENSKWMHRTLCMLFFIAGAYTNPYIKQCSPVYGPFIASLFYVFVFMYVFLSLVQLGDFLTYGVASKLLRRYCNKYVAKDLDYDEEEDFFGRDTASLEDEEYLIPDEDLTIDFEDGRLGGGGAGSVFKADWVNDSKPVAAKELFTTIVKPEDIEAFEVEVRNLTTANHRAVINFYGICDKFDKALDQTRRYIVMEYAEHGSLEDFLAAFEGNYHKHIASIADKKRKAQVSRCTYPINTKQFFQWAIDIASGLKYLNARGMPHRDVKPQNIFLDENSKAKIGDLGFAKLTTTDKKKNPRLKIGEEAAKTPHPEAPLGGTPEYMAPEAYGTNPDTWGEAVDVWAYGVVLMRVMTLQQPFDRSVSRRDLFKLVPHGLDKPFRYVEPTCVNYPDRRFKVLMESCLSFDPESRPSFSIIVNVLKSIQDKPEKKESEKGTLNPLKLLRRSIGFSVVGTARDSMRQSSARQRRTHRPKRSVDTQKSMSSSNIRATFSIQSSSSRASGL